MSEVKRIPKPTDVERPNNTVYILITQCLQNGFFFADDSRLCLDQDIVARMLLHSTIESEDEGATGEASKQTTPRDFVEVKNNRRRITDEDRLKTGPLYQFLSTLMDNRDENTDTLHAIHIRDWHKPSLDYDVERSLYGPHCEAGTWESRPLDKFTDYLSPWIKTQDDVQYSVGQQQKLRKEFKENVQDPYDIQHFVTHLGGTRHSPTTNVVHYPVLSDSVFDFRRSDTIIDNTYKSEQQDTQKIMAVKPGQTDETPRNPIHRSPSYLEILINSILNIEQQQADTEERELHVNIVVIGVYTDIKIRTLMNGLRSRYRIDNLVVSDVLTAAPSLERHLEALDFLHKVLSVEVVHSLNDLLSILAPGSSREISKGVIQDHVDFRSYRSYYLNKQNLLAYQDSKRIEYLELTRTRSKAIYAQVYSTNKWLLRFGYAFLILTVIFGAAYLISLVASIFFKEIQVDPTPWLLGSIVTGGLSLVQLFAVFFRNPLNELQDNLNNLIHLRSELETHSLILALLRYHFSTPERLSEDYLKDGKFEVEEAKLNAIQRQIDMIKKVDFDAKAPDTSEQMSILERINNMASSEKPPTSAG